MYRFTPEDLIRAYPEFDFLVAEGNVNSSYMLSIHQAFYRFAADQISGGVVLDAGCGTGFGTALLTDKANSVVGIDIKDKLIQYAIQNYRGERLKFVTMDVNKMGFANEIFDVVVADELLEHMPDHRPFLDEAVRILKPRGLFICATVNRIHTFGTADNPLNRNHFREYDAADFKKEIGWYFDEVKILGQGFGKDFRKYIYSPSARWVEWLLVTLNIKHRIPAVWRTWVRSRITGVQATTRKRKEFDVSDHQIEESLYLVSLARRRMK